MTAEQAAERVGMDVRELRTVNSIPPRMLVRAGSSLIVPRTGHRNSDVTMHVADNGHLSLQPEVVLRRATVRAHKGDNLAQLANRYGVNPVSAAGWNKLAVNARLKPGQHITLMLPQRATGTVVSSSRKTGQSTASTPSTSKRKTTASTQKSVKTAPQLVKRNASKTKVASYTKKATVP
jgi:membrane-bound lytic murein transglycosylase D